MFEPKHDRVYNTSGRYIGRIDEDRKYCASWKFICRISKEFIYDGVGMRFDRADENNVYKH